MQSNDENTTILVSKQEKRRLDRKKLHSREPYRDVLKRVLDEADRYEKGKAQPNLKSQKATDRVEAELDKIVKGRLAKWSTSTRSHETILLREVANSAS
jgi:hypothetical protein